MKQKLASLFITTGRRNRLSFLGWEILLSFIFFFIWVALGFVPTQADLFLLVYLPLYLLYSWANIICLPVQRLHDIGWSGWWCLLFLIPLVSFIFGLILLFKPSEPNANRYGDVPSQQEKDNTQDELDNQEQKPTEQPVLPDQIPSADKTDAGSA